MASLPSICVRSVMSSYTASLVKSAAAALASLPPKAACNLFAAARIFDEALPGTVASLKSVGNLSDGVRSLAASSVPKCRPSQ